MEQVNLNLSFSVKNSKLVKEVTNGCFLDENGHPVKGGLFDENVFGSVDCWQKYTKSYNGCDENWYPDDSTRKLGYFKMKFAVSIPVLNDYFIHIGKYKAAALYIVPPAFRPYVKNSDGSYTFHKLNYLYQKVFDLDKELSNLHSMEEFHLTFKKYTDAVDELFNELKKTKTMLYFRDHSNHNSKENFNLRLYRLYTSAFWPAGIKDNVKDIAKSAFNLLLEGDNKWADDDNKRRYFYQQAVNHIKEAKTCYGINTEPCKDLFTHCCNLFKNSKIN